MKNDRNIVTSSSGSGIVDKKSPLPSSLKLLINLLNEFTLSDAYIELIASSITPITTEEVI